MPSRHFLNGPFLFLVPPKFTKEPSNQYVIKGQPAFLSCETIAYPPARIEWSKHENRKFLPVKRGPRFNTLLDGTLIINNITENDEGQYVCTANNGVVGGAVSRHVVVTVHGRKAKLVIFYTWSLSMKIIEMYWWVS